MNKVRAKSKIGIYHVMLRGNNKQQIFFDSEDYNLFIDALQKSKNKYKYKMYAGAIMSNHIHLIIHAPLEVIANIIRSICASFVKRYNRKYMRVGSLFQPRYRSSALNSYYDLAHVIRYIHRNPVKAGICKSLEDFYYSSIHCYTHNNNTFSMLFDPHFIIDECNSTFDEFIKFNHIYDSRDDFKYEIGTTWLDRDKVAYEILRTILEKFGVFNIDHLDIGMIIKAIQILAAHNCSDQQIARILHLPIKVVRRNRQPLLYAPPESWTYIYEQPKIYEDPYTYNPPYIFN